MITRQFIILMFFLNIAVQISLLKSYHKDLENYKTRTVLIIHWTLTTFTFLLIIASGIRPKNNFIIHTLLWLTVIRCYLPFFDIDERRLKFDAVENSILLLPLFFLESS